MRTLPPQEVLSIWDRAEASDPVGRALALLGAACPERSRDELAALPLGRRDALLLELRQRMFGPRIECFGRCPACGEPVEFGLEVPALLEAQPASPPPSELRVSAARYALRVRPPSSLDLIELARAPDSETARDRLLERCVLEARCDDEPIAPTGLPEPVALAVAEALERCDPLAEVRLDLRCPACARDWPLALDIAALLWEELALIAERLLAEVHALARAYAWREADILAMSPRRRARYLELAT